LPTANTTASMPITGKPSCAGVVMRLACARHLNLRNQPRYS
jgi:hypothetical protein